MAHGITTLHGDKTEFVNNTDGYIGVVTYAPNGDEKPIAVEPGGTVWLSDAEQELTAKAPRKAEDNPFIQQRVPVLDPETGETVSYVNVTPLTENDEDRPTPAANARARQVRAATGESQPARGIGEDDAPNGSHDDREEIGTPSAQKPAAKRRRRTATV